MEYYTMSIPNINKIAKEVMPECITKIKRTISNTVLQSLGFDTSWSDIRIKEDSPLFKEILELDEYKKLKNEILVELKKSIKGDVPTKFKSREFVASIKQRVMWNIENEIRDYLVDEYTKQAMAIIKADPSIAPSLIAANFIKANSK